MRALILTGKLVQDHEFIYPYYRLKEEDFDVTISLKEGEPTTGYWTTKIPPDDQCEIVAYENLWMLDSGSTFDDDANLLVIPGGAKCMEYMRQEPLVLEFIRRWDEKKKVIACICNGAQLLISAKCVKGRKISGYYSIKDDIINAGAEYVDAPFVVDGNIITSPHYKYMGEWMFRALEVLHANTPD